MSLEVIVRDMYRFNTSQEKLARLVTRNVKEGIPSRVNVPALRVRLLDKKERDIVNVHMLIGPDDPATIVRGGAGPPDNPNPLETMELQRRQFLKNLDVLDIKATHYPVIQVINIERVTGIPGVLGQMYTSLIQAGIEIWAVYPAEPAIQAPLEQCDCAGEQVYRNGVVSMVFEVNPKQISLAQKTLNSLVL